MRTKTNRSLVIIALIAGVVASEVGAHHDGRSSGILESNLSSTSNEGAEPGSGIKTATRRFHWLLNTNPEAEEASEFPDDLFTDEQLRQGAVIFHCMGALYSFTMIGLICSNYFLPSVDCICLGLNLSQDVAAATFMSFATTAPELFTVLIGTFITESDIGLGAVIGSGMFNILGVATFGGLAAATPIQLDWWPLIRDSAIYIFSLIALVVVIYDGEVTLTKAAFLFSCYFVYFLLMLCNQKCRRLVKACMGRFQKSKTSTKASLKVANEMNQQKTIPSIKISMDVPPVIFSEEKQVEGSLPVKDELDIGSFEDDISYKAYFINYDRRSLSRKSIKSDRGSFTGKSPNEAERKESVHGARDESPVSKESQAPTKRNSLHVETEKSVASLKTVQEMQVPEEEAEEEFPGVSLTQRPEGFWAAVWWVILWPGSLLLYLTVPDCRVVKWRAYYPLTFLMCVFWIGVTSYFGNWMISVIGDVIGIPESVMGLTFLAAGGSMPEAFSTVIMARQGEGGLGFSNSLGGNTMDICLCLGLPWLLKCSLSGPIKFESRSLQYSSIALFIGIFILIGVSVYTKFNMNKKMGIICCACYLVFIVLSVLVELTVIPS